MKFKYPIKNIACSFLLLCVSATLGAAAEKPMNVLMLIADDLNSWLLENPERYAGKVIAPNLKALGGERGQFQVCLYRGTGL